MAKRGQGKIYTNLDNTLSEAEKAAKDQEQRQLDFIAERTQRAEKAEKQQGLENPSMRYEWMKGLQYTRNPTFDRSVESLKNPDGSWRTQLPVKEYVVTTEGQWDVTIPEAGLEAMRLKIYCAICGERQPDDDVQRRKDRRKMLKRMKRREFALPPGVHEGDDLCTTCGAVLGISGDAPQRLGGITAEQKKILGLE